MLSTSKPRHLKPAQDIPTQSKWKAPSQQRLYSRRLLDALRRPSAGSARAIKDAADSALALAARGQSRWSRAILTSRCRRVQLRSKLKKKKKQPRKPPAPMARNDEMAAKEGGKVEERLRRLGRLVPGCRKLAAPSLLEEAADYVAALEVQVKAMRELAEMMAKAALTSTDHDDDERS